MQGFRTLLLKGMAFVTLTTLWSMPVWSQDTASTLRLSPGKAPVSEVKYQQTPQIKPLPTRTAIERLFLGENAGVTDFTVEVPEGTPGTLLCYTVGALGCSVETTVLDSSGMAPQSRNNCMPVKPGKYTLRCKATPDGSSWTVRYSLSVSIFPGSDHATRETAHVIEASGLITDTIVSWRDQCWYRFHLPVGDFLTAFRFSAPIHDWFGLNLTKNGFRISVYDSGNNCLTSQDSQEGGYAAFGLTLEGNHDYYIKVDSDGGNYNPVETFGIFVNTLRLAKDQKPTQQLFDTLLTYPEKIDKPSEVRSDKVIPYSFNGNAGDGEYKLTVPQNGALLTYKVEPVNCRVDVAFVKSDGTIIDQFRNRARPVASGDYSVRCHVVPQDTQHPSSYELSGEIIPHSPMNNVTSAGLIPLDQEISYSLVSWLDKNWFAFNVSQKTGYIIIEWKAPTENEFGINLFDNGFRISLLAPDGKTCLGKFNTQANNKMTAFCAIRQVGRYAILVDSDGGSYNAHASYVLRVRWSETKPQPEKE